MLFVIRYIPRDVNVIIYVQSSKKINKFIYNNMLFTLEAAEKKL